MRLNQLWSTRISRFLVIGCLGFVTDALVLALLLHWGLGPAVGRFLSILTAVSLTFVMNKKFAFLDRSRAFICQYFSYVFVSSFGATINFVSYLVLISVFQLHVFGALVIASLFALIVNFLGYDKLVFSQGTAKSIANSEPGCR